MSYHRIMAILPSVLALATLLVAQTSAFGDTGAQNKTNPGAGGAVVIAIICYSARKKPIGGWLLYYYINLYAGLAFSVLLLAATLQNYSPARWQSTELYALAIASTMLGQLMLLTQVVVATILLRRREWKWLRLLRAILIIGLLWSAISIALDSAFFSGDSAALDCLTLVWLVIWLAYFFQSTRVKRVFLSKDWGAEMNTMAIEGASVSTIIPDAPNSFPQKTKTGYGALLFLLFAIAFCTIAILYFRPWEQHEVSKPETYNPSKPPDLPPSETGRVKQQSEPLTTERARMLTSAEIFRGARPSVVLLSMQDARGQPISLGSGFFVDRDVVATNFHVIDGAAAGYAKVTGRTAKLKIKGTVGLDAVHDLALLQLDASPSPPLPVAAKLLVNIGDAVYAIGNPQGLEGTFSQGIVSSVRTFGSDRILQITAPISPGSSGGPVLDQTGSVVGVSFASIEKGQNLNFAIPSDYLAALQDAKTELRPFVAIPRAKLRFTLLDRIGNERPLAGVVGENLTYDDAVYQTGRFSLSLHNKLKENITSVYGIVIFHDVRGEPIDVYPIIYKDIIPAGTAKRISGAVDKSVERLNCPDQAFPYLSQPPRTPKGKIEFRILDFSVE